MVTAALAWEKFKPLKSGLVQLRTPWLVGAAARLSRSGRPVAARSGTASERSTRLRWRSVVCGRGDSPGPMGCFWSASRQEPMVARVPQRPGHTEAFEMAKDTEYFEQRQLKKGVAGGCYW